jgi:osmotically inducible protein OsmC
MKRKAGAVWKGGLKDGSGTISTESRALAEMPYDFAKRFEDKPGTNPEELIAAAHASCFSMALSGELGKAGLSADSIRTTATVTMVPVDGRPTVTDIHLEVKAKVPGAAAPAFQAAAQAAKEGCPISRLLAPGAPISMDAQLE